MGNIFRLNVFVDFRRCENLATQRLIVANSIRNINIYVEFGVMQSILVSERTKVSEHIDMENYCFFFFVFRYAPPKINRLNEIAFTLGCSYFFYELFISHCFCSRSHEPPFTLSISCVPDFAEHKEDDVP